MTETAASLPAEVLPAYAGTGLADPRVQRAIDLACREAELLDRTLYLAWQELYSDEAVYVVPIDRDAESFDDILNMVYDDKRMRALRVARMTEGHAMAVVDAATTVRTVGRFVPAQVTDQQVTLRFAQTLVAYKRGRYDLWAGDIDYVVRLGDSPVQDRIQRKVIRLVDSEAAVPAAGFLL